MSETTQSAKAWEGQIVDGKFPLRRLLGETDHSAVFLTEYGDGEAKKKAAIKLVAAEGTNADLLLANWNFAAHLTHSNLLQLFQCGRCTIHGNDVLYLVMEYADENLADILTHRALTVDETRDMLLPVLDALEYLHGKGLVQRDIKPANILASGDQLKISSDAITRVAEGLSVPKKTGVYDPPEAISGVLSPAGDVWALGTTLVEVLTQKLPEWQPGLHREPVVPATVPAPFQEIARHCLRLEPDRRMRIAEIAARLNPRAAIVAPMASAAAASAGAIAAPVHAAGASAMTSTPTAAPRRQPVSDVPPRRPTPRIPAPPARPEPYATAQPRSRFIVPLLVVGALVFAVILVVPRLLTNRPEATKGTAAKAPVETAQNPPAVAVTTAKTDVKPKQEAASGEPVQAASSAAGAAAEPNAKPSQDAAAPPDALKATSEKDAAAPAASSAVAPASPAPVKPKAAGHAGKGEVLDQVLPDVPQKARDTIQGRVRVGVKVHVDAAGAVTGAELDSPGPSKYFADWALQAAKKWAFTPPEVDGKSVESDWILRFVFTQTDTKVTPTQTAP
ncbi:MAG TPA: TonB family protein [Candidatus Methylomirabilis sp.]|nr:TonB family protein [Candidatus Methylomirabilis sp.]